LEKVIKSLLKFDGAQGRGFGYGVSKDARDDEEAKIYLILEVWMTSWDMEERVCGGPGIGILNRHIMIGVSLVNPGSRFSMQQSKENHLW